MRVILCYDDFEMNLNGLIYSKTQLAIPYFVS